MNFKTVKLTVLALLLAAGTSFAYSYYQYGNFFWSITIQPQNPNPNIIRADLNLTLEMPDLCYVYQWDTPAGMNVQYQYDVYYNPYGDPHNGKPRLYYDWHPWSEGTTQVLSVDCMCEDQRGNMETVTVSKTFVIEGR
ncbi:MAG TPA: hypothetical protein DCE41_27310 [Cytophagales bacterium]|nr:hypothetical protein [Cytophagales bacterium]HAA21955.1 hypothetical protein [Cytophagales bacterium]HAP61348.1 hypothetical protein [Cytophagales bacterium]